MRIAVLLGVAFVALAACGGAQSFACLDDAQCVDGSRLGTCEPTGFCSFPDPGCPSGTRYGEHAGSGLAGECVDDGATTGIASTTATITDDSSPSTDPTMTTGDPVTSAESTTDAPMPVCGNGIVEAGENCDGEVDFDCRSLGWDGGAVQCDASCGIDQSACTSCGDGIREGDEQCDAPDFAGATCMSNGFFAGELGCDEDCRIDLSACNDCGNGEVDAGELCDGQVPIGLSCNDVGFGSGQLACVGCDLALDECNNPLCGLDPNQPLGDCPAQCDKCEEGFCIISCAGSSACAGDEIVCPPGHSCYVICDGSSACANTDVVCSDLFGCQVSCSGTSGCANLDVACGEYGQCELDCQEGTNVCTGATVTCGYDNCTTACGATIDSFPELECQGTCVCSPCND